MADFVDKSLEDSKGFFLGLGSGILVINKFKRERTGLPVLTGKNGDTLAITGQTHYWND
jgi:hypothetical protein